MNTPADLRYAKSHEWVRMEKDHATVGITDHAQTELNDVVFVDLPKPGKKVNAGDVIATVESVKAASDIYAPIGGEVTEANAALTSDPGLINREPYATGWLFRMKPSSPSTDHLLSASQYAATLKK
jgi:glycine cleavage system H protein